MPTDHKFQLTRQQRNYIGQWIGKAIEEEVIPVDSPCYQEVDAGLTSLLKTQVSMKWKEWPVLASFSKSLFSIGGERAYQMYADQGNYGENQNQKIPTCWSVNHPAPNFDRRPAFDRIVTTCDLLQANSLALGIVSEEFAIYPVVLGYDVQPLKQGTFVRWNSAPVKVGRY